MGLPSKNHLSCQSCEHKLESVLCNQREDLREKLDAVKVPCEFKSGQVIFYAGNEPLGLYSVQSGLVKLEVNNQNGDAHTLRLIGPGGLLGYRSLFANEKYHATAVALRDVQLCFIPKAEVLAICSSQPDVMMRIMGLMSKELRQAESRWMDQVDKGASERIAEAVVYLNDHFYQQTWTRREIAQFAGTTPETVMRCLAQFEKDGLIEQSGRDIHIKQRLLLMEKAGI